MTVANHFDGLVVDASLSQDLTATHTHTHTHTKSYNYVKHSFTATAVHTSLSQCFDAVGWAAGTASGRDYPGEPVPER